jgi:hypothetical protein
MLILHFRRHTCLHTPANEGPIITHYEDDNVTKTSVTKEEFQAFSSEEVHRPVLQRLNTELEVSHDERMQTETDYTVEYQQKYAERQQV